MKFSPLFWPIKLKGNTLYILDETLLPQKLVYVKAKTYQEAAKAIKDMKTRAFGQVLLVFCIFLLVLKQNKDKKNIQPLFEKVARVINATRPTLPFKFLTDMVLGWAKTGDVERKINGFLEVLKEKRIQRAQEVA